jgi:hypothetical protein
VGTRFSSLSDDEVGGLESAIRAERAQRARQSNCVRFHEPSPTTLARHPRPGRNLIKIQCDRTASL